MKLKPASEWSADYELYLINEVGFSPLDIRSLKNGRLVEDPDVRQRRSQLANELKGLPAEQWPDFEVKWDMSPTNFYLSMDGATPQEFTTNYPRLIAKWTDLEALCSSLSSINIRETDELWLERFAIGNARVLAHWVDAGIMTPPHIVPIAVNKLVVIGGNHRLAIARAKKVQEIPIIFDASNLEAIRQIVPLTDGPYFEI